MKVRSTASPELLLRDASGRGWRTWPPAMQPPIGTAALDGARVLDDRERTLDSPTDKIMLSLTAFADELEREKARQRTYDAMSRKARAGQVTGGRVFGYDNVEVLGSDGEEATLSVRSTNRKRRQFGGSSR